MKDIFAALSSAAHAASQVTELQGRDIFIRRAIVTSNTDPTNNRRIKVAIASKGGQLESDFVQRCNITPSSDEPLPKVGQTVLISAIDGDPHSLVYFGVITNDPNPSLDKSDSELDRSQVIEGKVQIEAGGNYEIKTDEEFKAKSADDFTVDCGKSIRLQNTAGAYLELNEAGFVVLGDAYGHVWTLGGSGGSTWEWNANGASIEIVNASDFKLNGKSAASVGAKDSRNDTIISKGW